MRKNRLTVGLALVMLLVSVAGVASPQAAPKPATKTVLTYWGSAEISVPQATKERLDLYATFFNRQVAPQVIVELRKEDPTLSKEIGPGAYTPEDKDTISVRIEAEDQEIAVARARKAAEMAISAIVSYDENERAKALEPVRKQVAELEHLVRVSQEDLLQVRTKAGVYGSAKELDFLLATLHSYREQLVQAEMKEAELLTKLKMLANKAAEVKDAPSIEQITLMEKTVQELDGQVQELEGGEELNKLEFSLKMEEQELQRVTELHKKNLTSQSELEKAQFELLVAREDYERAKRRTVQQKKRLDEIRKELADARGRFSATGGADLASAIAQKTLECETEIAGNKAKIEQLRMKITELEAEIPEKRALALEGDRIQAKIDVLSATLEAAWQEEKALERTYPVRQPRIVAVTWNASPRRITEPEHVGWSEVQGGVNRPGQAGLFAGKNTLMQVIEAVGGFTEYADPEHVTVFRPSDGSTQRHVIDCKAILDGKAPDNFIAENKDLIWVPAKEGALVKGVEEPVEPEPEGLIAVEVNGEVKSPGAKKLARGTGLLAAIEEAGGLTDKGDGMHIRVARMTDGAKIEHIFDYTATASAAKSKPLRDFSLSSGDVIDISQKGQAKAVPPEKQVGTYEVMGEIKNPGSYSLRPQTTLLKAVAEAGGFTDYTDRKDTVVIRKTDGATQRYYVDCDAVLRGTAADDFMILPGDTIWVPRKGIF